MMNKKMREILAKIEKKTKEVKDLTTEKNFDEAKKILGEIEDLKKEFEIEKGLFENEKLQVPDEPHEQGNTQKDKATGFKVLTKMLGRKNLDETEKALIIDGENGENYLLPEDVRLAIIEFRKQYKSAKSLVTAIKTQTMTGSFNFEKGVPTGLTPMTDGEEFAEDDKPKFDRKPFAIKLYGKLIPVSNILKGSEKAGLMPYIDKWFIKNAIISENEKIFGVLKADKTPIEISGCADLKKSINVDLDPDALKGAKIVTNQTGFNILDSEVDEMGRPMLQPNPTNATQQMFKNIPIEIFSDGQLPNVDGKAPIFYGAIDAGCYFIERKSLEFAVSEHYLFNKNQTALRVIEGFDVIGADKNAYAYGLLKANAENIPTV